MLIGAFVRVISSVETTNHARRAGHVTANFLSGNQRGAMSDARRATAAERLGGAFTAKTFPVILSATKNPAGHEKAMERCVCPNGFFTAFRMTTMLKYP
jgi:hypothetical protein